MLFSLKLIFFFSLIFLLYVHLLYPVLLFFWSRVPPFFKSKQPLYGDTKGNLPKISVIIACYNEEKVIGEKIENTLSLNYPNSLLEIFVFSDGSDDLTDEIVRSYAHKGICLLRYEGRIGKTACQNLAFRETSGDIILFTDSSSMLDSNCLLSVASKFCDEKVGCVVGRLVNVGEGVVNGVAHEESFFLQFSQWVKSLEGLVTMPVGGSGALFAVRSSLVVELPKDANDDLLRPLYVVLQGYRIVYDGAALAVEALSESFEDIFSRKKRIGERAVYSLVLVKEILNPFKYGFFSLQVVTKILLRRLVFPALLAYIVSGIILSIVGMNFYYLVAVIPPCLIFILSAFGRAVCQNDGNKYSSKAKKRIIRLCYYYVLSISGAFLGLLSGMKGNRTVRWGS